jgi:redox-sensitive bicupin YhaK (pirin superfamily)
MEATALTQELSRSLLHQGRARPCTDLGWRRTHHSLANRCVGPLHLLDEHLIVPGEGQSARLHKDAELLLWVLEGALEHQDSSGNTSVIEPGELVRLRAGPGTHHSAYNASDRDPVRFLECRIQPAACGITPDYEHRRFHDNERRNRLRLIASPDGTGDSVRVEQELRLYTGIFDAGRSSLPALPGRIYYAHCTRGTLIVDEQTLAAGDALELQGVPSVEIGGGSNGELLLFDLPAI